MQALRKNNLRVSKEFDEAEVIAKSKKNLSAFAPIYEKYHYPIFIYIYKRVGNENLASDLCQQCFVKAMQNIKKYEDRGLPFGAWLTRIAFNEMNLFFRDQKKQRVIDVLENELENLADELDTNGNENYLILLNTMKSLSHEELSLIELKYFEGKSYDEICQITDMNLSQAKTKIHRIVKKLKEKISHGK